MMKEAKNVPKLRFPEFTDDWGRCKVSDVSVIIAGGTPSTSVESYWVPKEIPWLSSGEVHKKYITFTDNMISVEGMNHSSARMIEENSVLIALAGQGKTRGTVAINRIPLTTNQSIAAMTFNENMVPEFVFDNLDSRYDEIRKLSSGDGSRGGLNKQLVGDIIIPYTSKAEQKKISDFLTGFDTLISLQQRKLDQIKEYKKGMLQKMFPKDGESVPEVRFPEFTGDWEQRKLDDVMSCVTDYVAAGSFADIKSKVSYISEPDFAQLVRTVDLKKNFTNDDFVYVDKTAFEYLWRVNLDEECIVLPNIGANIGEVYYVTPSDLPYENNVLGPNAILLKTENDTYFVFTALSSDDFQKRLFENVGASGQPKFNKTELKSIIVFVPSLLEQKKIGKYFKELDNLIVLHQRKLDAMREYKKGLLQQMFV